MYLSNQNAYLLLLELFMFSLQTFVFLSQDYNCTLAPYSNANFKTMNREERSTMQYVPNPRVIPESSRSHPRVIRESSKSHQKVIRESPQSFLLMHLVLSGLLILCTLHCNVLNNNVCSKQKWDVIIHPSDSHQAVIRQSTGSHETVILINLVLSGLSYTVHYTT